MSEPYQDFLRHYIGSNSWSGRKDGVPLELLDALSPADRTRAEDELIKHLSSWRDSWPIAGLGHLRSTKAQPKLYSLLRRARGSMKAEIATALWKISGDKKMLDVVIKCSHYSLLSSWNPFRTYSKIDIIYCLAQFPQAEATARLEELTLSDEYLVSYNAKRALDMKNI